MMLLTRLGMNRSEFLSRGYGQAAPAVIGSIALSMGWPALAEAHVKWFAPFDIALPPRPFVETLTSPWVWLAVAIAVPLFAVTAAVERIAIADRILTAMDRVAAPLWSRADDFVRATTAAFFIAIFAIGGVYLTPDLRTPSEWASWAQLFIAAGLFWRRTMWLSAIGILALWGTALHEYPLFHLLDYLVLGLGVAGYLVLFSLKETSRRDQRFTILRWAIAITLMRSSLEKFAYADWFYPLVQEKPFLTFGMPADVFLPMAGVVEFILGLGLIWTPIVRRLSAIALLIIFNAAVVPFGRLDLVGHGLIMMMLVVAAIDPARDKQIAPAFRRTIAGVSIGFMVSLAILAPTYWNLHAVLFAGEQPADRPHMTPMIKAKNDADRRVTSFR
jgi:hypothetical protein